jgi:hypothetical protein
MFVDNTVPFIIEKMSSDKNSREQSLNLLKLMVIKFDHTGAIKPHLQPIIYSMMNDYFNLMDSEI